ncbi:hypothetical protein Pelo_7320 [Pelomyxa schiedti]|nr:hypothetical protein Pelo_7320 [Pelomyxa schiedti]
MWRFYATCVVAWAFTSTYNGVMGGDAVVGAMQYNSEAWAVEIDGTTGEVSKRADINPSSYWGFEDRANNVYHFTQYSTETCLDSVDVNGGRLLGTTAMDYKDSTGGAWDATTGNIYVSAQGTESKYWYICKANNVTGECPLVVDIPGALGKYGFGVAYNQLEQQFITVYNFASGSTADPRYIIADMKTNSLVSVVSAIDWPGSLTYDNLNQRLLGVKQDYIYVVDLTKGTMTPICPSPLHDYIRGVAVNDAGDTLYLNGDKSMDLNEQFIAYDLVNCTVRLTSPLMSRVYGLSLY